jgi:hypothetical protein
MTSHTVSFVSKPFLRRTAALSIKGSSSGTTRLWKSTCERDAGKTSTAAEGGYEFSLHCRR